MAASVGEQVTLLQRKIEQSSATLRMLQGMGQKGVAITDLQQQVREKTAAKLFRAEEGASSFFSPE
jgi:hypothetical protein